MSGPPDQERRDRKGRGAPLVPPPASGVLPQAFYARPSIEVARDLLGTLLISTVGASTVVGRIVETEAYFGPEDDASHAAARIGRTPRNDPMFGDPGTAYVYRIYGVHWCLNAVSDEVGHPAAVLIRAASPVAGFAAVRARRGELADHELMRGPGNLCRALGVTGALNFHSLRGEPLIITPGSAVSDAAVARGPRIGITRAADLPLRFWIRGDPAVSRTR